MFLPYSKLTLNFQTYWQSHPFKIPDQAAPEEDQSLHNLPINRYLLQTSSRSNIDLFDFFDKYF